MTETIAAQASLYRRALGADYERLPGVLRRFHNSAEGGEAEGSFRVRRGKGFVRNTLANAMTLPAACDTVTVHLDIKAVRDGERWIRRFGPKRLVTERGSGWSADRGGRTCPVWLPPLRGRVEHGLCDGALLVCGAAAPPVSRSTRKRRATGRESSWLAMVQVEVPLLGVLVRYEGEMTPRR